MRQVILWKGKCFNRRYRSFVVLMREKNIVARCAESNLDPPEERNCCTSMIWLPIDFTYTFYLYELYSRFINGKNMETIVLHITPLRVGFSTIFDSTWAYVVRACACIKLSRYVHESAGMERFVHRHFRRRTTR